jgi:hypothetical protein
LGIWKLGKKKERTLSAPDLQSLAHQGKAIQELKVSPQFSLLNAW